MHRQAWSGMLVGSDGYPTTNSHGDHCIAGGDQDYYFSPIAIEFYGVKTLTWL